MQGHVGGTLTPLALAAFIPRLRRMPHVLQVVLTLFAVASVAYATWMLVRYLPGFLRMIRLGDDGPRTQILSSMLPVGTSPSEHCPMWHRTRASC